MNSTKLVFGVKKCFSLSLGLLVIMCGMFIVTSNTFALTTTIASANISPTSVSFLENTTYTLVIQRSADSTSSGGIRSIKIISPTGYGTPTVESLTVVCSTICTKTWTSDGIVSGVIKIHANTISDALKNDDKIEIQIISVAPNILKSNPGYEWTVHAFPNLGYDGTEYTITIQPTTDVKEEDVTVIADVQTKFYGDLDPTFTYTFNPALQDGDIFSGLLSRALGENVGSYAIDQGTLSAGSNYNINYVSADLDIKKKDITLTADIKTKEYGDADPELTYQITDGSLIGDDLITGNLLRQVGEGVGEYNINQNTITAGDNYNLTFIGAKLFIKDTTSPTITIIGENPIRISRGSTYNDLGATVADAVNNDLIATSTTNLDVNNDGTYVIKYGATDLYGNSAEEKIRTVVVYSPGRRIAHIIQKEPIIEPVVENNIVESKLKEVVELPLVVEIPVIEKLVTSAFEGNVLGVSTFVFNKDMKFHDNNNDVKELQLRLINEGFLTASSTGYFGVATRDAVIKYQEKYMIEILTPISLTKGTGYAGPNTRARLNK